MIRLALMRHGHTTWNREGRLQGRSDLPLDGAAKELLARFALPDPWHEAALVLSPLQRAVQTAELVGVSPVSTETALTEMSWGAWEGQHGTALLADPVQDYRHIEDWGWDYRPPDGESPRDVLERVAPWVEGLTRDTVAVCHIGVMRVLLARATGWNFDGPPPFRIKRNRLYVLGISNEGWTHEPDPIRLRERGS